MCLPQAKRESPCSGCTCDKVQAIMAVDAVLGVPLMLRDAPRNVPRNLRKGHVVGSNVSSQSKMMTAFSGSWKPGSATPVTKKHAGLGGFELRF